MNKFNWSDEELLANEQRKKCIMEEIAAFAKNFDESLRIGEEKGILIGEERGVKVGAEKGREEGEKQAKIAVAKNLRLSVDKIKKLKN